jgi:hypothetical protein
MIQEGEVHRQCAPILFDGTFLQNGSYSFWNLDGIVIIKHVLINETQ